MKTTGKLPHRRRREQRTNYRKRFILLKSRKPRLVIRGSANAMSCQVIAYHTDGDKTVVTTNATQLKSFGWKGHGGNLPSAYLTGLLCGAEAKKRGVANAVADFGLTTATKWSRFYAALKGAVDGGLDVPHGNNVLPPDERVAGTHIAGYAEKLKDSDKERYKKIFSSSLKNGLLPEQLPEHFEQIKKKILC